MEIAGLRIEEKQLATLNDAHYNARKDLQPDDAEYRQIEASLDRFKMVEPLVWNIRTDRLVSGHQRKKILIARGEQTAPVVVVDLSEEDEKALSIALNRGGRWEDVKLAQLLDQLRNTELLPVTGFTTDEIDGMLDSVRISQSTDFLNGLTTPEPTNGGGVAAPATTTERPTLIQMSLPMSVAQRDVIMTAIRKQKNEADVQLTSVEALVKICEAFNQ